MIKIIRFFIVLIIICSAVLHAQVTQQWVKRYNGGGNSWDEARKVLIDKFTGDVYVTGRSIGVTGNYDIVTIKYNSAGTQQWMKSYNGIPNGGDDPLDMVFDNLGNLIITGTSSGTGTGYDCVTLKYSFSGNLMWVKRYNGTGNGNDYGVALTPDSQGGIVVTGRSNGGFQGINTYEDIITIKYDYFGNQEWLQRYNGAGNSLDGGNSVTVDNDNNVYVTGYTSSTNNGYDMITIKYAWQGNMQWVKKLESPAFESGYKILNSYKYSEVIVISPNGPTTSVLCYDYSGNLKWQSSDFGGFNNFSSAVIDDDLSMLYITGQTTQNGTSDYMVIGLNLYVNGGLSWFDIYNGTGNGYDYPNSITIDKLHNIYITGYSAGSGSSTDYTTLKYNLSGIRQWEARYNNTGTGTHVPVSISADNNGNVLVTGYSQSTTGNFDFATVKYSQSIILSKEGSMLPSEFMLHQNYPNPFNPSTKIKFDIPYAENVKVALYDLLGREVQTLAEEFKEAGSYEINFDGSVLSSGTYFYKITAGNFTDIKKMVLLK